MQNKLRVFENSELGKVRVIEIDGQFWWVLRDVCLVLGLSSPHKVAERLDEDEKGRSLIPTLGGTQEMAVINESGLYAVILRSDKPKAKSFRRWITSEVLPSIRKHGAYITDEVLLKMLEDNEFAEKLIQKLCDERSKNDALLDHIEKSASKIHYYDAVLQSPGAIPVSMIAQDYGLSAIKFNKVLRCLGVQYRKGRNWYLYNEYANKGYTVTRTQLIDGKPVYVHLCWTQRGRKWLYELLKAAGLLPKSETQADCGR